MRTSRLSLVLCAVALVLSPSCSEDSGPKQGPGQKKNWTAGEQRGLKINEPDALDGYTLISPIHSDEVYLLDMQGEIVHTWDTGWGFGGAVYMIEDGQLIRGCRIEDNPRFRGGGIGGSLRQFTWEGEEVWSFELADEQRTLHHDTERLPNGNILMIAWEYHSPEEALQYGRAPEAVDHEGFWPDVVIEVKPTYPEGGEIVWQWQSWNHLIQDTDPDKPRYGVIAEHPGKIDINADHAGGEILTEAEIAEREAMEARMAATGYLGGGDEEEDEMTNQRRELTDWLHTNSVAYNAEYDLIVLSSPRMNEIYVIDHSTTTEEAAGDTGGRWGKGGQVLYRWGNPRIYGAGGPADQRLFFQHNPTWIEDEDELRLLIFNNGMFREGNYSTAEELILPFDPEIGFVFRGENDFAFDPEGPVWEHELHGKFFAPFISGAQRLPNGNTLICCGVPGRIVEVTPDGRRVWDYLNPHGGEVPLSEQATPGAKMPQKAIFRATRIPADDPRLEGRL